MPRHGALPWALLAALLSAVVVAAVFPKVWAQPASGREAKITVLADLLVELIRVVKVEGTESPKIDDVGRRIEALLSELAPPDPADVYRRGFDDLSLEALRAHHPALAPEWEAQLTRRRIASARAVLQGLRQALEQYDIDHATYPPALATLRERAERGGPYISASYPLVDPWGRAFVYRVLRPGAYDLLSVGPDGREGTADDIR